MHNSAEIGQLESINELVELYKRHISSEKLTVAHSYELNILSSIAVQVQNQRKFLISHSAEHFKRFELALAELISTVKTITNTNILKLYKESTIYQVLINIIFQQGQAKLQKDESDHINYLKDTNSLCIIFFHIQSALSQLNGNIKEDTLTIRRTLQIIGEYLKSSKNTLNLSNEVIEAIKSKGISVSDFRQIRDKLSHISALFNLQREIESKDIEKLKKDLESIKYVIDEEIYHMQYNFVKVLTHKADKICKEENKEVKEKLSEMVKMVDTKEFYKNNVYELTRLSEKIFRMIDDNEEVKALLSSIFIITRKAEELEMSELDSAFSLPENPGINVLREMALQDVPADELYENLYGELFKNLDLEDDYSELNRKLEEAHKDVKVRHILISFFDGKIFLEQDEYEKLLQDILDDKLKKRLKGYNQSGKIQDQNMGKYRKYITDSKNKLGFFYDSIMGEKHLRISHFERFIQQFKLNDSDKQTLKKALSTNINKLYLKLLKNKLELLKSITNKKHKFAIEYVLLDVYNLMIEGFNLGKEVQNQLELSRNYLAHGNRIVTALYPDIEETVISQAKKICEAIDWTKSNDDFLKSVINSLKNNLLLPKMDDCLNRSQVYSTLEEPNLQGKHGKIDKQNTPEQ